MLPKKPSPNGRGETVNDASYFRAAMNVFDLAESIFMARPNGAAFDIACGFLAVAEYQ